MSDLAKKLEGLSPEKRALLERRLREKAKGRSSAAAEKPRRPSEESPPASRRLPAPDPLRPGAQGRLEFSLFYFSSDESRRATNKHRLLLEGARFADRHGFDAVWTPERHFHPFGGLYPNPSLASAALAMVTERIHLRAGSVVMPLHRPLRVAEEWALVDNLSGGRAGIAFASGWHAHDFAFFPQHYKERRQVMAQGVEQVRRLWRGESVPVLDGRGNEVEVKIYPEPLQAELPFWLTAGGSEHTFRKAGEVGANLLTNLLGQSVEGVARRVEIYRSSLAEHGHDPDHGRVTLMLHSFLGESVEEVRRVVRDPFCQYLRSFGGLLDNLAQSMGVGTHGEGLSEDDIDSVLSFAFDRYFNNSGLFGTPESCLELAQRLRDIGVDEVACLVDFGVDDDRVLASLEPLDALRRKLQPEALAAAEGRGAGS
ncbi:MAG: LLM class flavin-dependent oxidoreductase [Acidobacteriota bacterium]